MLRRRLGSILLAPTVLSLACAISSKGIPASNPSADREVAFLDVQIVPMDHEAVVQGQTVLVRNGRIVGIGPTASTDVPRGVLRIDGRGKFLMPGLADMHTHTWSTDDFPLLIANGVTTIRNMWGAPVHLEWRQQVRDGELLAPTIYTAGPPIDGNPPIWPGSVVPTTPEEAERVVMEQKQAGYDFIKVYWALSPEIYEALIDAARRHRIPAVGHVPWSVGLGPVLEAGQTSIEHLSGYDGGNLLRDKSIWMRVDTTRFAEVAARTRESGTWNCPTLVLYQSMVAPGEPERLRQLLDRPEMRYVAPAAVESWYPENSFLKDWTRDDVGNIRAGDSVRKKLVKALHDAGAGILLGTDYGNQFVVPGFSLHQELRNLVDAGLTPYEAIRAGTVSAAESLGLRGEFGTVSVGARADLILLEDNPLGDVRHILQLDGVMIRGRWLPRAELQDMLNKLAASHRVAAGKQGE